MRRGFEAVKKLRLTGEIEIEGLKLIADDSPLLPGDSYVAGRNSGPHLLTVRRVDPVMGCVYAVELAYPFDTVECVKVTLPDTQEGGSS